MASTIASSVKLPSADPTSAAARREMPALAITSANLRVWGKKSALSLIDQALTSGVGFGVNIFLARMMSSELYGAFAVAFAGFLFITGFHNVLLLEPLSVMGPSRHGKRLLAYFRAQIVVHALLVGGLSAAAILTGLLLWRIAPLNPLARAILGAGLALPFMLLLWLTRRMCYVVQHPSIAVIGSAFYFAFVLAGLFDLAHFGGLSSFRAFMLMGCGSVLAAVMLLWRLGLIKSKSPAEPRLLWSDVLRENWAYGRWLVGSTVLFSLSSQTQTFLVAGVLGLGAAGILRAMQIPSLVMTQVVTATGLLVLPTFSYDFGHGSIERTRHKAMLVSAALCCIALCFAAFLAFEAVRIDGLLFKGKFAAYVWLMPVFALIPAINGISVGYSMAMRAWQKPHFDLISNLFAAPVAIGSAFIFMSLWGLPGAVASILLSFGVLSAVTIVCFKRSGRSQSLLGNAANVL